MLPLLPAPLSLRCGPGPLRGAALGRLSTLKAHMYTHSHSACVRTCARAVDIPALRLAHATRMHALNKYPAWARVVPRAARTLLLHAPALRARCTRSRPASGPPAVACSPKDEVQEYGQLVERVAATADAAAPPAPLQASQASGLSGRAEPAGAWVADMARKQQQACALGMWRVPRQPTCAPHTPTHPTPRARASAALGPALPLGAIIGGGKYKVDSVIGAGSNAVLYAVRPGCRAAGTGSWRAAGRPAAPWLSCTGAVTGCRAVRCLRTCGPHPSARSLQPPAHCPQPAAARPPLARAHWCRALAPPLNLRLCAHVHAGHGARYDAQRGHQGPEPQGHARLEAAGPVPKGGGHAALAQPPGHTEVRCWTLRCAGCALLGWLCTATKPTGPAGCARVCVRAAARALGLLLHWAARGLLLYGPFLIAGMIWTHAAVGLATCYCRYIDYFEENTEQDQCFCIVQVGATQGGIRTWTCRAACPCATQAHRLRARPRPAQPASEACTCMLPARACRSRPWAHPWPP